MHNLRQLELCQVRSVQGPRHSASVSWLRQSPSWQLALSTAFNLQHILNSAVALQGWYEFFSWVCKFTSVPFGRKQLAEIDLRIHLDTKRKKKLRSICGNIAILDIYLGIVISASFATNSFFGIKSQMKGGVYVRQGGWCRLHIECDADTHTTKLVVYNYRRR